MSWALLEEFNLGDSIITTIRNLSNKQFIFNAYENSIIMMTPQSGRHVLAQIPIWYHTYPVRNLDVLPDGRIVSSSLDGIVSIWNISWKSVDTLNVNETVYSMCVVNRKIVTASKVIYTDSTFNVKVWSGKSIEKTKVFSGSCSSLAALGGSLVISAGYRVMVWDLD